MPDLPVFGAKSATTSSNSANETSNSAAFDVESDGLKVYPNPANDYVALDLSNFDADELQIVDIKGGVLLRKSLTDTQHASVDIRNSEKGLYMFHLLKNGAVVGCAKWVKQ